MTIKRKILSKAITPEQKEIIKEQFPDAFNNGIDPSKFNLLLETQKEPDILYHYTTMGTLQSILNNVKEKGTLILRGTHVEYLNDETEYVFACGILEGMLKDYVNIMDPTDKKDLLKYMNSKKFEYIGSLITGKPYVTSLSENHDNLPMWNTYGDNGRGVAIGIKKETIANLNASWVKCSYDKESFKSYMSMFIKDLYEKISFVDGFTYEDPDFLLGILYTSIKHFAYEYENEWRIVKCASNGDVKHQENKGILKPYIDHSFEKEALKEIIIGPCADKELAKKLIECILEKVGYDISDEKNENYVKIRKSEVPFR
ncbi:DUF2971 domain-containing protein [Labilibaculum antarcticum]|uniref:DUF2971 domain-containing protein n=1 Tax=Labilibaculum antarcticum TaxID=1717717 RepID=A0A1Y1CLY5_9BACT|nr:DUF2971 domain-containing protein [Labilibaculum antarcticum]BAX80982.1 hypothetical protein ALGA_2669 [Labilibaculum antarcticum]